ncbi:MAG TPA: exodeoxyribonuclease III [Rhizobiales bacterium]|nr:exodeoxyribonuclease III [Hyphomicrobiales bacterium]
MIVASWNVNSIKVRLPNVLKWLEQRAPDIACLQEIKCIDANFPAQAFEDIGYNVAVHGQKTYNGVAILSKLPFDEVLTRLPGDEADEQARYLEAVVSSDTGALRVACLYLPNGNPVETEKYSYKLDWMDRLKSHAKALLALEEPFVLAGDYNVIPEARDVYDPPAWAQDALFCLETREKYHELVNLGLTDSFRACTDQAHQYTFWDYQRGAWTKDHGLRIDHLLLSPQAADRLQSCEIDKFTRGWERPSDHAPIWADIDG